jgi:hypothetical protein
MQANVGTTDRMVRIIAGVGIIGTGIYLQSWWGTLGLVLILTGLFSRCPGYSLVKMNTCVKND